MSIYSAVQFQLSSYTTNKYSRSGGDKSEKMMESIDDDGAQRRQCSSRVSNANDKEHDEVSSSSLMNSYTNDNVANSSSRTDFASPSSDITDTAADKIQDGGNYSPPQLVDTVVGCSGSNNNNRRVSFRDSLVTHTSYRPSTTRSEKVLLYYTREQYEIMALELYYEKQEEEMKQKLFLFSWEDFVICESFDDNSLIDNGSSKLVHIESQDTQRGAEGNYIQIIHKVQTLCDLHT